jgi:hypothetical protein
MFMLNYNHQKALLIMLKQNINLLPFSVCYIIKNKRKKYKTMKIIELRKTLKTFSQNSF